jgi:site-specific DNA-methyltransferase (adenine-specific)/modification methylase
MLADDIFMYLGDCRNIVPDLKKSMALVTDPPYGIARVWRGGKGHGWGKADEQKEERNAWDESAPDQATFEMLLNAADYHVIWGGNYFELPLSRGWLVWGKPEQGKNDFTLSQAELAWTSMDAVIKVCNCLRSDSGREHPTQKPVALMEWCIEHIVPEHGVILDPYAGSGTTGVAAVKTGRPFVGIEVSEKYYDIACRRIDEELKRPNWVIEEQKSARQQRAEAKSAQGSLTLDK